MPKTKQGRTQGASAEPRKLARYKKTIEEVFLRHYREGADRLIFKKDELAEIGRKYDIAAKNIPDIVYTYRSRRPLPDSILAKGHPVVSLLSKLSQIGPWHLSNLMTKRNPMTLG
ncbi:MAG: hypothetical protein HY335_00695 [Deinococcus sp.]|nr:hypothetical protein [Deinococcus sp.]